MILFSNLIYYYKTIS